MQDLHKIIFFIGPSSSGKDTFFAKILSLYQVHPIILLTTRPPRVGEVDGREYYFISMDEMNNLEVHNKLIERRDYDTVNGIWSYATEKSKIDLENFHYLTPNTWVAYKKFLDYYSKNTLVPIYFEIEKGIRLERALEREKKSKHSDYAEMCRRFLADEKDFNDELIGLYQPIIINNNGSIENTMEQIDDVFVRKLGILPKKS